MIAQRVLFGDSGDSSVEAQTESAQAKMERMMKIRYGEIRRRDKDVPHMCDCSAAIHVATSNDPNTRGIKYFSCPYDISDGSGQGCGFRRWWIEALLDEFAKTKEEKNEMHKCLEEAHKLIESQEGRIYELQMQYEEVMQDQKQLVDYGGELFETVMGVAQLNEKYDAMDSRFKALEKKYQHLNKYL